MSLTQHKLDEVIGHVNNPALHWGHEINIEKVSINEKTKDIVLNVQIQSQSAVLEMPTPKPVALIAVGHEIKFNTASILSTFEVTGKTSIVINGEDTDINLKTLPDAFHAVNFDVIKAVVTSRYDLLPANVTLTEMKYLLRDKDWDCNFRINNIERTPDGTEFDKKAKFTINLDYDMKLNEDIVLSSNIDGLLSSITISDKEQIIKDAMAAGMRLPTELQALFDFGQKLKESIIDNGLDKDIPSKLVFGTQDDGIKYKLFGLNVIDSDGNDISTSALTDIICKKMGDDKDFKKFISQLNSL